MKLSFNSRLIAALLLMVMARAANADPIVMIAEDAKVYDDAEYNENETLRRLKEGLGKRILFEFFSGSAILRVRGEDQKDSEAEICQRRENGIFKQDYVCPDKNDAPDTTISLDVFGGYVRSARVTAYETSMTGGKTRKSVVEWVRE